ncbi:MAG: Alanine racemase [Gammaproteobacteria bacterium]|nr:Alanine racemase [Gammaproteobacteria bacterium]
MSRGIRARIDRSALTHNLRHAKQSAPKSRVMAVVKANGYGHGLVEVAQSLSEADAFAVEDTGEAITLRRAGIEQHIVLLSGFHDVDELDAIARWRLSPVIHDHWQMEALRGENLTETLSVWVKIDSGMQRIGFFPRDAPRVLQALESLSNVRIDGVMSHLANADDLASPATRRQCRVFQEAVAGCSYPRSLANSPGVLGWPATHMEWIRPGMMLYGCSPLRDNTEADLGLRPAMTLESRIIAIKDAPAGAAIGYGGTWRCSATTQVGVLACGYGDGYPRHVPNGTPVWVNDRLGRILGRVSMDLTAIDLSGHDGVRVGDWVELWGGNVAASLVAAYTGTIPYELVCRLGNRVPRIYEP